MSVYSIVACPFLLVYNERIIMSFETLFTQLLHIRQGVFITLALLPVAIFGMSFLHGVYDGRESPWRQIYALVVHLLTAVVAAVGAVTVYHILENGSAAPGREGLVLLIVFVVAWLLLLVVVKRAVDFSMIRSVRNPFVLLLSWAASWAVAWVVELYGLLDFPLPRPLLLAIPAVVAFFIIRIVLSLFARDRS
jgi:hypothetical protein